MGIGYLTIHAITGDNSLPVANANVKISDLSGNLLYEAKTDANGKTQTFEIEAPSAALTLDSNYNKPAYSKVNVDVTAKGYISEHITNVEIVDTQTAYLPVMMKPLADEPNPVTDHYLNIDDIALLTRGDEAQTYFRAGAAPTPAYYERLTATPRVLDRVFIPDYITVHLGAPTNAAARNIRVRFTDYIKNVTSSEIYSTWPTNSLITNIHAIVTLALNRVYTEWYPSRGYNFDITNSTQFDTS